MTTNEIIAVIAVVAAVTALLRFVPFAVFAKKAELPRPVLYLGRTLPYAIMGMLVVYCLKDINPTVFPFGLPELISGASVALLHLWRRNTLLSIIVGTVLYMLLIRFVFV